MSSPIREAVREVAVDLTGHRDVDRRRRAEDRLAAGQRERRDLRRSRGCRAAASPVTRILKNVLLRLGLAAHFLAPALRAFLAGHVTAPSVAAERGRRRRGRPASSAAAVSAAAAGRPDGKWSYAFVPRTRAASASGTVGRAGAGATIGRDGRRVGMRVRWRRWRWASLRRRGVAGRGGPGRRAREPSASGRRRPPARSPAASSCSTPATTAATPARRRRSTGSCRSASGVRKACDTTGTATASGYTEAAYNWDVAKRTRRVLENRGARVILTRKDNHSVGPCIDERARIANRAHADLRVSIHADGGPPSGLRLPRHRAVADPRADGRHLRGRRTGSRSTCATRSRARPASRSRPTSPTTASRGAATSAGCGSPTCRRCSSRPATCAAPATRAGWQPRAAGRASRAGSPTGSSASSRSADARRGYEQFVLDQ